MFVNKFFVFRHFGFLGTVTACFEIIEVTLCVIETQRWYINPDIEGMCIRKPMDLESRN